LFPATSTLTINGTSFTAGTYSLSITGTSGSVVHSRPLSFNVGDYSIAGTQTLSLAPGGQGTASLKLTSSALYSGKINATCDASALSGAMCALAPANPISLSSGGTTNLTATVNVPSTAAPGNYNIVLSTQDNTGAPSHSFTVALTVAQDFLVTSSTASQTVTAGQTSGPYNLTIQPVGASFNGAVTLACSAGIPTQAQCIFNPSAAVTPGSSAVDVVMSISTTAKRGTLQLRSSRAPVFVLYALWLLLPGIAIGWGGSSTRDAKRKLLRLGSITMLVCLMLFLSSCGGVSTAGGTPPPGGNQPVIYHITVTGTSAGTAADAGQSVQVVLVVN
jgi:hypothetical protein